MVSHAADRAAQGRMENAGEASRGPWMWGIVAVGAVLRLIALGHKSFWIDEIASVAIARRAAPAFWHTTCCCGHGCTSDTPKAWSGCCR